MSKPFAILLTVAVSIALILLLVSVVNPKNQNNNANGGANPNDALLMSATTDPLVNSALFPDVTGSPNDDNTDSFGSLWDSISGFWSGPSTPGLIQL